MIGPRLLHVDLGELSKLEKHLARTRIQALPYAAQNTVNNLAFEAQRYWREEMPQRMTLRSKYTQQSVQVDKSKTLNIGSMQSTVGSVASYMDEQELGAVEPKNKKHGVPIPAAAPGKRKTRGKLSQANQFKALKIMPRVKGHRSRQVAASLSMAAKRGGPQYAFLRLGKGKQGIYRLNPGKKRAAVRKVWDLSKPSITIPKNPTMEPATQRAAKLRDGLWREALIFQLHRAKAFGY